MKHISKIAFLFSSFGLIYAGCSSSTSNPPPVTPSQVHYAAGSDYRYTQNRRDTSGGAFGNDGVDPTKADTITSVVLATNQTFQFDTSDVTIIQNTHTSSVTGAQKDTTDIAQENGNYWHYNYGLEGLSSVLAEPVGWVLQAKFGAKPGDTWVAVHNNAVKTKYQVNADVLINALEMNDTTISGIAVKHVQHSVTISAVGQTIAGTIDTYVSPEFGMVRNTVHSSRVAINLPSIISVNQQVSGSETVMVSHP
ncbi:MAG: hypothetical protein Q8902_01630 [Bacteroidota bacterium]|nr:hypothetical protein [Bacteroidota bacterium]MDP4231932.1 hypothetical protein [Bacteroidota bacterium]MDP4241361.1 hypothetical protein [Bacteroidota bacterium]